MDRKQNTSVVDAASIQYSRTLAASATDQYNISMNDPEKRLTNLEMSIAHLQHDLETLDKAVLDNTEKLDQVLAMLKRLNKQAENSAGDEGPRNPEDEKPPHY